MFRVIDRVEDRFFGADATVSPGGWCCNCWCCCSISFADYPDDGGPDPGEVAM